MLKNHPAIDLPAMEYCGIHLSFSKLPYGWYYMHEHYPFASLVH
jgi:hypothetical protein